MNNTNIHKVGVCRKSSVVLSLLLGAATLVQSTLTSSAGATQFTVPFDVTVDVPGLVAGGYGECPEINYPLHLIGVSHLVIQDKVIKGGDHELTIQNGVKGIATDALGNTFVFSYNNHLRGNFEVSLGEETTLVFVTDKFTMEGEAGHFSMGFVGTLVFNESGFLRLEVDHSHGNYVCDPI